MMKKFAKCMVGFVLIVATIITLCGCGASKHVYQVKYASGTVKQAGEKAVEVIDQYLAYNITKTIMAASLAEISGRIGNYEEYESLSPEHEIAHKIFMIANFADHYSDIEILQARDLIAVNCGLQETGEVFTKIDEMYLDDDEKYIEKYKINMDGMSGFRSYKNEDGNVFVTATFDYSYGYSPELMIGFIELLLPEVEDGNLGIDADIEYYDKTIARVHIGKSHSGELYAVVYWWYKLDDKDDWREIIDFSSASDIDNLQKVLEGIEIKR